ncbi:phosphotransferase [Demequina sp.]|uniref:phosphotransferase n=1 Tax=Demequina sp. TaxID=2050685 RepID=UPI003D0DB1E2
MKTAGAPLEGWHECVREALAASGAEVISLHVDAVHRRPGAETSLGVVAHTDRGEHYLVVTDAELEPSAEVTVASGNGVRYAMWAHPADPALPGLAAASTPEALSELLGEPVRDVDFLAYRPMRRAVLRAHLDGSTRYVKVVRPAAAERNLAASLALGTATVPVTDHGSGVLSMPAAHGEPLDELAHAGRLPAAADLVRMVDRALDAIADSAMTLKPRPSWTDRRADYAAQAVLVGLDARIVERVLDAVQAAPAPGPVVPTHGDVNAANVWLDLATGEVSCLIDADTVGPGYRVDDHACLVAHLVASSRMGDGPLPALGAYAWDYAQVAFARAGNESGYARAAAVLLSLAATTEDTAAARRWMDAADEFASASMRGLSPASPRLLSGARNDERMPVLAGQSQRKG